MRITVVPYDPRWPELFRQEAAQITRILGENAVRVFHIGSTSVPGLAAKPVIDIMPVVHDMDKVAGCAPAFEAIGYEVLGEFGMPGRCYMRKGGDNRSHQIHTFQYDSTADILRHLAFRDYLRCHPEQRAAYGALKSRLAERYPSDIVAYGDGKESLVKQLERDALKWYWENQA
ncbi:GrpB family protein [Ruminococcaceae bacterium OttesenSCG-928-D13]|nr:GrpB family protein [Ruminococcaceae bacterium OttesenSCG-928-D13]